MEGDGRFTIDTHSGAGNVDITGTHHGRGGSALLAGKCNGTVISFAVVDPSTKELICYLRGTITSAGGTDYIRGKFNKPLAAIGIGPNILSELLPAPDDWEADKTT